MTFKQAVKIKNARTRHPARLAGFKLAFANKEIASLRLLGPGLSIYIVSGAPTRQTGTYPASA
jgi:hypothetical protein